MDDSPDTVSPVTARPWPLRLAMTLLSLQAAGLALLGGWLLILTFSAEQTSAGAGVAEAGVAVAVAVLLGSAAISLGRGHSGMRGVAIFIQLTSLPLGYYLAAAGLWLPAVVAWIVGLGTAALLVSGPVRESTGVY